MEEVGVAPQETALGKEGTVMVCVVACTVHLSCRAIQHSQQHDASFARESCRRGGRKVKEEEKEEETHLLKVNMTS